MVIVVLIHMHFSVSKEAAASAVAEEAPAECQPNANQFRQGDNDLITLSSHSHAVTSKLREIDLRLVQVVQAVTSLSFVCDTS